LTVAPWTGAITIDATLEGGAAHATAIEHGPHELLLEDVANPMPSVTAAAKPAATHTSKPRTSSSASDINLTR
jgi:hypothetical protein